MSQLNLMNGFEMTKVYYFYNSNGRSIPAVFISDKKNTEIVLKDLADSFKGSQTPIVTTLFEFKTVKEIFNLIDVLEAQLTNTPKSETGLIHSIESVLRSLRNDVG